MRTLLALCALLSTAAYAQAADVQAKLDYSWTPPTTCAVPTGQPIAQCPLTKLQAFVSTASIADTSTMAPTAELPANATSFSYSQTVPNGTVFYARFKACAAACSAFSAQVSKAVMVSIPNVPANVNVTVTVTVSTP